MMPDLEHEQNGQLCVNTFLSVNVICISNTSIKNSCALIRKILSAYNKYLKCEAFVILC